ncbi:sigma 54-interacting transcriptional regulator [Metabacillus idriensis]|uniref:sigma 54-interacting transcriptional regulator n=1 Tax=Metabacillus idriensis TaxID=324768 RepID=UPI001CD49537|nr:sigma 54-interacting transcriptional regulator [Metabacillus idriensis]
MKDIDNQLTAAYTFDEIIGEHSLMIEKKFIAKKLARADLPIIIEGPTGSGKQMFGNAIHNESNRKLLPFVSVNCSTFSDEQLQYELFGSEHDEKAGLFEKAEGGTIFLNDISSISLQLQAQLLRVLQERQVQRIGSAHSKLADVRIIASSAAALQPLVAEGSMREDLYYHLNVLRITLPSLIDRSSDIPLLAASFLKKRQQALRIDKKVMDILMKYHWPGNVLELKNIFDYLMTVCDGRSIQLHDLPKEPFLTKEPNKQKKETKNQKDKPMTLMDKQEYLFILESIRASNEEGEPASRRIISDSSKNSRHPLTPQQVRHRLDFLEKNDYITKGRGRAGTKITLEGLDFLQSLTENLQTIQKEANQNAILD